jgi:hypothetical protein
VVKYILNYYDTKQHENKNETTQKMIMDTKKHENENKSDTKQQRKMIFVCFRVD